MRTVILGVSTREKSKKRLIEALAGKPQGTFISFESSEAVFEDIIEVRNSFEEVRTALNKGEIE